MRRTALPLVSCVPACAAIMRVRTRRYCLLAYLTPGKYFGARYGGAERSAAGCPEHPKRACVHHAVIAPRTLKGNRAIRADNDARCAVLQRTLKARNRLFDLLLA